MFDKLTYWNLETPPNSDDTVVMAMDWPELADAVSVYCLVDFVFYRAHCIQPTLWCPDTLIL